MGFTRRVKTACFVYVVVQKVLCVGKCPFPPGVPKTRSAGTCKIPICSCPRRSGSTKAGVATGAQERDLHRGVGAPEHEGNQPVVGTSRLSADKGMSLRSRRSPRQRRAGGKALPCVLMPTKFGSDREGGIPAGSRRPRSAVLLGAGVPSGTQLCFDRSRTCQSNGCETGLFLLKIGKGSAPKGRAGFTAAWCQPGRLQLSVEQSGDHTASL